MHPLSIAVAKYRFRPSLLFLSSLPAGAEQTVLPELIQSSLSFPDRRWQRRRRTRARYRPDNVDGRFEMSANPGGSCRRRRASNSALIVLRYALLAYAVCAAIDVACAQEDLPPIRVVTPRPSPSSGTPVPVRRARTGGTRVQLPAERRRTAPTAPIPPS